MRTVPLPADVNVERIPIGAAQCLERFLRARHRAVPRRQHHAPVRGSKDGPVRSRAAIPRCVWFWLHRTIVTRIRRRRSLSNFTLNAGQVLIGGGLERLNPSPVSRLGGSIAPYSTNKKAAATAHATRLIFMVFLSCCHLNGKPVPACLLALWRWRRANEKRQRTGAVQDATAQSTGSRSQSFRVLSVPLLGGVRGGCTVPGHARFAKACAPSNQVNITSAICTVNIIARV